LLPGISSYTFAFNNPVYFNDPTGLVADTTKGNDPSQAFWPTPDKKSKRSTAEIEAQREASKQRAWAQHYAGGGSNPSTGGGSGGLERLPRDPGLSSNQWGGGVWFQNLSEADRLVRDINTTFRAVYGVKRDVVGISKTYQRANPENKQKYNFRLITNNAFDWNTDLFAQGIWDMMNQDIAIYGDLLDMGNAKDAMGLNAPVMSLRALHHQYLIVETSLPNYSPGNISLASVFFHELVFHKNQTVATSLMNDVTYGSNKLYLHFAFGPAGYNKLTKIRNPFTGNQTMSHKALSKLFIPISFKAHLVDQVKRKSYETQGW
jgi:hypothetical protein